MKSGKSTFAEDLYKGKKDVVYIATANPSDEEMKVRIRDLKINRPKGWLTYETDKDLQSLIKDEQYYLLDCVTSLISNQMYEYTKKLEIVSYETELKIEKDIMRELDGLIYRARKEDKDLLIVTNEVGSSLVPMNHIGRVMTDIQGRINQSLAKSADEVYLVISGISLKIK